MTLPPVNTGSYSECQLACVFRGSVAMLLRRITQSRALMPRYPLNMTNTREAHCYGDTEPGPSVMDCSEAMY